MLLLYCGTMHSFWYVSMCVSHDRINGVSMCLAYPEWRCIVCSALLHGMEYRTDEDGARQ